MSDVTMMLVKKGHSVETTQLNNIWLTSNHGYDV